MKTKEEKIDFVQNLTNNELLEQFQLTVSLQSVYNHEYGFSDSLTLEQSEDAAIIKEEISKRIAPVRKSVKIHENQIQDFMIALAAAKDNFEKDDFDKLMNHLIDMSMICKEQHRHILEIAVK